MLPESESDMEHQADWSGPTIEETPQTLTKKNLQFHFFFLSIKNDTLILFMIGIESILMVST